MNIGFYINEHGILNKISSQLAIEWENEKKTHSTSFIKSKNSQDKTLLFLCYAILN